MGKRHQLQCRRPDVDPDIFFSTSTRKIERAKQLCAMCPAQHQCLLASFARPGELGTWGGMTQDERTALVDAVDSADELEQDNPESPDPDPGRSVTTDNPAGADPDSTTPPNAGQDAGPPPPAAGARPTPDRDHAPRNLAGAAA
ncbi:MAG: WhiB family transcriptional regulator [Humibacillus sp.]|nr:WhiB family transcriptional regulator [Humibacillus sp.]MDN5777120.1 WhiB family transcriptional regulator [Humibacillus sp.]